MLTQITHTTRLAWIKNTPIQLCYVTGEMPTNTTTLFEGEFFCTGLLIHASQGGKITIEELDDSSKMIDNLVVDKKSPFRFSGSVGELNAYKFYSGVKVKAEKTKTHFQLRGFKRVLGATPQSAPGH